MSYRHKWPCDELSVGKAHQMGGIEQKFCLFLQSSQSELKILNEKLSTELLHKDQRLFLGMYHLGICDACSYHSCIILTSHRADRL